MVDWKRSFGTAGLAIALASRVLAQEPVGEEIVELAPRVVTANPMVQEVEALVVPADRLEGGQLSRNAGATLGETLKGQPGVHSTYFGPGAGRPIIRGFDGDRVRILNQGTESFDVSQTSPDHAVGIEPLFSEAIEVVRGPASLLYGNAAIGGVVNVIGKDIPQDFGGRPFFGEVELSYASNGDEKVGGLVLGGDSGKVSWRFGYLNRDAGNVDIPGYADSDYLRELEHGDHEGEEDHEHEEDHDHEEGEEHEAHEEEVFGVLENSFVETETGFIGMTWFGDASTFGGSYSKYDTAYGVPGHSHSHGHEEEGEEHEDHEEHEEGHDEDAHEEEDVWIDLDLSRLSFKAEFGEQWKFWEKIETKFSYGDYRHREIEGDEVGTTFERDGYELRVTGLHEPIGNLVGVLGLHLKNDSFIAEGEEAFIPSNDSSQIGVFTLERLDQEWGAFEFGGRLESVTVDPLPIELSKKDFTTVNGSLGVVRRIGEGASGALNLTYAERAPNSSELFAFGPHVATRNFEIGDPDLDKERSINLDASYRILAGPITGEVTVFYSDFDDYVYMEYLDESAVEEMYGELDAEGFDVYRSVAADASFYGYEIDLRFHLIDQADQRLHFDFLLDQTRATNDSSRENLPRIPTRRLGGRIGYEFGSWSFGFDGTYHYAASHLAPDELPTDDYLLLGLDVRYRIQSMDTVETEVFLSGTNLGDEEARPHTSFLKDLVPMPGRSWKLGLKTRF